MILAFDKHDLQEAKTKPDSWFEKLKDLAYQNTRFVYVISTKKFYELMNGLAT